MPAAAGMDEPMSRCWASLTGDGGALGLLTGMPGYATGPYTVEYQDTVDGYRAVGEVTLHNPGELRAALATAGYPVPAECPDGELLLRAYARLGPAGIRLAEGMFVLAVLVPAGDRTDLVLVRDHVGT